MGVCLLVEPHVLGHHNKKNESRPFSSNLIFSDEITLNPKVSLHNSSFIWLHHVKSRFSMFSLASHYHTFLQYQLNKHASIDLSIVGISNIKKTILIFTIPIKHVFCMMFHQNNIFPW